MADDRYTDALHALNAGDITVAEFNRITRPLKKLSRKGLTALPGGRKVYPSTNGDHAKRKEPPMTRKPNTSKTTPSKSVAKKTPAVTAATVARDAGIDPYKFRVFLRANDIKRDARSLRAAVKKFKADTK